MAANPDDQHVFHRNQDPTNQDHFFDLGIARLGPLYAHLLHKGSPVDFRGWMTAGDKLEEIREHSWQREYCPVPPKCNGGAPGSFFDRMDRMGGMDELAEFQLKQMRRT